MKSHAAIGRNLFWLLEIQVRRDSRCKIVSVQIAKIPAE